MRPGLGTHLTHTVRDALNGRSSCRAHMRARTKPFKSIIKPLERTKIYHTASAATRSPSATAHAPSPAEQTTGRPYILFLYIPAASEAHASSAAARTRIASACRQRAPTACARPLIRPRHSLPTHSNRSSQPHHDSTDQRRSHLPHPTSRRAIDPPRSAKPQPRSPTVPITPLATTTSPRSSPEAYPPPPNIHSRPAYTFDEWPNRALGRLVAFS